MPKSNPPALTLDEIHTHIQNRDLKAFSEIHTLKLTNINWGDLITKAIDSNFFELKVGDNNAIPDSLTIKDTEGSTTAERKLAQTQTITLLHLLAKGEVETNLYDLEEIFKLSADKKIDAINTLVDSQLDSAINALSSTDAIFVATELSASTRQEAKGFLYQITSNSENAKFDFLKLMATSDNKSLNKNLLKFFSDYAPNHPFELGDDNLIVKKGGGKESDALMILDNGSYQVLLATSDDAGNIEKDSFIRHPLAAMALSKLLPHSNHLGFTNQETFCKSLCAITGESFKELGEDSLNELRKSKNLLKRRAKSFFYFNWAFSILSSRPGLCNYILQLKEGSLPSNKKELERLKNIDFESDYSFPERLPTIVEELYDSHKPGLFFGLTTSRNSDKKPRLFDDKKVENLATERAIVYTVTHINNMLRQSTNYSTNAFQDLNPGAMFQTLIDPVINILSNKASLVNYTQLNELVDNFVDSPASIIDYLSDSHSNQTPTSNTDKILYSNLLESVYQAIPQDEDTKKSEFKNNCLTELDFILTDGAKSIFNEEIIPVEYTTAIKRLKINKIQKAISDLQDAAEQHHRPAIDLLQDIATQSEFTIHDKTITIDTDSQELAKQALNELKINPITKDQKLLSQ